MKRAGADLHVIGLQDDAAVIRPIALQRQDQSLERARGTQMDGKIVAHVTRNCVNAASSSRRSPAGSATTINVSGVILRA